jgi:hypothetical protein
MHDPTFYFFSFTNTLERLGNNQINIFCIAERPSRPFSRRLASSAAAQIAAVLGSFAGRGAVLATIFFVIVISS